MGFQRGIDGSEPLGSDPARATDVRESIRPARTSRLGSGTLACPRCDAPVAPTAPRLLPPDPLACPFCGHAGAVRDFLSLAVPSRPAHVEVHVVLRAQRAAR